MKRILSLLLLVGVGAMLFLSCQATPEIVKETVVVEATVVVEVEKEVEVTREVEVEVIQEVEVTREVEVEVMVGPDVNVPFEELWASSGHADAEAEAFTHWNEDGEVSERCAKCHSTPGYRDFIGADGSEPGVVNAPAALGTTVECEACHNDVTMDMDSVVMPSGIELTNLGAEARCMQCHQGRQSKVSVDAAIEEVGVDDDTVSEDLGFRNIHYYAAAATKYGTLAKGGYEYEGKMYDGNFAHVSPYDTCIDCHNAHTLEVKVEECQACHEGVSSAEDLKMVRMAGSLVDYDGDGDMSEGIYDEIVGLQEMLFTAIQAYGSEVAGSGVVYDSSSYPYFFDDAGERFGAWTPRLLRAAYNYQVSLKDPGEHAHGGKYIIQLLYDSIEDLNTAIASPVDLSNANRIDHGHFAGSEEAFRHWDEDGEVPGRCSRCHSADGLPLYIQEGVTLSQPLANGFKCETCHDDLQTYSRYEVGSVEFPSGAVIQGGEEGVSQNTLLCMNCHQGRQSGIDVANAIDGLDADAVSDSLRFLNIHYFAAGATRFGADVNGGYQYPDQEYSGYFVHRNAVTTCADCHDAHTQDVKVDRCADCHEGIESTEDLRTIRMSEVDYDGDGDVEEGVAGEIATMHEALYVAIQAYAEATDGVNGIVYDSHRYPYFFDDAGERYGTWTPTLLEAAYNYQYVAKDPGGFAHNPSYMLQLLYDTIAGVGGDVSGMTRADVVVEE